MIPETQYSLIMRLADQRDDHAWEEFVLAYQPVIRWAAEKQGLQPADAEDVVQQVLASIARALPQRPHDPARAKFRTWLFRVTHNAVLNSMSRRKPDQPIGGDSSIDLLANLAVEPDYCDQYERQYERAVFQWAARKIKAEFQSQTWEAFWLNMVKAKPAEQVAMEITQQFGRPFSVGSVYAAKSRVLKRLREKVQEFDESCQI